MKTSKYHNLIRINLLTWIILAITTGLSIQAKAQSDNKNALLQMIDDDHTTIDAIAGYDEKYKAIFFRSHRLLKCLTKLKSCKKDRKLNSGRLSITTTAMRRQHFMIWPIS